MSKSIKLILGVVVIVVVGLLGYAVVRSKAGADSLTQLSSNLVCPSHGRVNPILSSKAYIPRIVDGKLTYDLSVSLYDDTNRPVSRYKARLLVFQADTADQINTQSLPVFDSGLIYQENLNHFQVTTNLTEGLHYFFKAIAVDPDDGSKTVSVIKSYDREKAQVTYSELLGFTASSKINIPDIIPYIYIDIDNPVCESYPSEGTINFSGRVYATNYNEVIKQFTLLLVPKSNSSSPSKSLMNITDPPSTLKYRYWYEFTTDASNVSPGDYYIIATATNGSGKVIETKRELSITGIINPPPIVTISNITISPSTIYPQTKIILETDVTVQNAKIESVNGGIAPSPNTTGEGFILVPMIAVSGTSNGFGHYKGETVLPTDAKVGQWESSISVVGVGGSKLGSKAGPNITVSLKPQETHDLSVTTFSAAPNPVKRGKLVNFSTTIKNIGTVTETNLVVTYSDKNGKTIGIPQTIPVINPGEEKTITLKRKVEAISVRPGTYTVNAKITPVAGEQNTQDNSISTQVRVTR